MTKGTAYDQTPLSDLLEDALSQGAERGEFDGAPEAAALHIMTVTRGLAVLERAFGDETQLRDIAAHTVDLLLGSKIQGRRRRSRAN